MKDGSEHEVLKQSLKTALYSRDSVVERCKNYVLVMLKILSNSGSSLLSVAFARKKKGLEPRRQ